MTDEQKYTGPERRAGLSEAEMERIAEIAAKKALELVYLEVGKTVLKRLAWLVGAAAVGLMIFLGQNHIDFK